MRFRSQPVRVCGGGVCCVCVCVCACACACVCACTHACACMCARIYGCVVEGCLGVHGRHSNPRPHPRPRPRPRTHSHSHSHSHTHTHTHTQLHPHPHPHTQPNTPQSDRLRFAATSDSHYEWQQQPEGNLAYTLATNQVVAEAVFGIINRELADGAGTPTFTITPTLQGHNPHPQINPNPSTL